MKAISSLLIILSISTLSAVAQERVALNQVIALALQKNYDILLTRNDSALSAVDRNLSYGALLPTVNATGQRIWNTNDQRQGFADDSKREQLGIRTNNTAASVNLDWVLFDGLKMFATRERLEELYKLGALNVKEQVIESVASVISNYYNIVRQKQQLRAIEEQIAINQERVKLADTRFSAGLGVKPELLQAQVDLNAQKAARLKQQTLIAQLKEQLNQLAGLQLPKLFDVSDSIPLNTEIGLGDLANNLEQTNPSLLIARKNVAIANLAWKERRAERFPTLAFTSSYNFTRQLNSAVVRPEFQALSNRNLGFNYGFAIAIPILNNFTVRRNISAAQWGIRYQELFYENQLSIVNTTLTNAYKDYEYQRQALALEEQNIQLAKENVSIALERFRLGVSTNLELREAQISLEVANNRLIDARYNTKLAETELLRLKGDLVQ